MGAKAGQNALAYKCWPRRNSGARCCHPEERSRFAAPWKNRCPAGILAAGGKDMINLPLETEALAQRLALAKRLSVEEVIRLALEEKIRAEGIKPESGHLRDPSAEAVAARRARTDKLVAALAAMPVLDRRSPRDIMDDLNAV